MKILKESITQEKERLLSEAKIFSNDIKENLDTIKTNVTANSKHVALIGGILIAGVALYRLFRSNETETIDTSNENTQQYVVVKSDDNSNFLLGVFKKIILDLMLSFAKKKLEELIKSYEK